VSQDGHPIGGSIVFSVGEQSALPTSARSEQAPGLKVAIWALRALLFLTLFVGVGGAVFYAWAIQKTGLTGAAQMAIVGSLGVAPIVAMLSVGLLGLDALGLSWSGPFSAASWRAGFATSYAMTALLAGLAALFAATSLLLPSALYGRLLCVIAVVATGTAITASGHASTVSPQFVSRPAVAIHVISLTLWLGALLPLADLIRSNDPQRAAALRRFSQVIPWPIAGLIASGVVIAVLQFGKPSELISTAYGRILLSKLVLVACLFVLAAYNRYWLTEKVLAADKRASVLLVRAIATELLVVLAILGTVALWRFTPPPRSMVAPVTEISVHLHGQQAMALAKVSPGKVGTNSIEVTLTSPDSKPLMVKEVRLSLAQPQSGIERIQRELVFESAGKWTASNLILPVAGTWLTQLDILIDDFHSTRIEGTFTVQG
jgi:copper transport protein